MQIEAKWRAGEIDQRWQQFRAEITVQSSQTALRKKKENTITQYIVSQNTGN